MITNTVEDIVERMVEIQPLGGPEGFRKIKETLTRMGVPSRNEKTLCQSAHILHRRGRYYICHFKEMFEMDGKSSNIDSSDFERRNRIVQMLKDWGLVEVLTPNQMEPIGRPSVVKVLKHDEKEDWNLVSKYQIGVKKV